jgi:hypothetical protein
MADRLIKRIKYLEECLTTSQACMPICRSLSGYIFFLMFALAAAIYDMEQRNAENICQLRR